MIVWLCAILALFFILAGRWTGRYETEFVCLMNHWDLFAAGAVLLLVARLSR